MLNAKFSPWPSFTAEEQDAVSAVLASNRVNYWTGREGRLFEEEFAAWCGVRYAVALANGTVALEIPLQALGIGPGDEVVVTPRSFIASVSCVARVGATPVFADVDPDSGNITAATIERVLTPRTKAILCVHLAGWPCDMDGIMNLSRKQGLFVVEDCAQAHGARTKGRSVGSIGHLGAWSFCQDKIMTTGGEGGMVTTNDTTLYERIWSLKDHGKNAAAVARGRRGEGFQWVHESFGGNARMLEIQAAIGRIQLRRMQEWTAARQKNAEAIHASCRKFPALRTPIFRCASLCSADCAQTNGCRHAYYKCYVMVEPSLLAKGWSRDRIISEISALNVPCLQGSCPEIYLEKAFEGTGWRPAERLHVARQLGETSLMFLVHPTLSDAEIEKTCHAIESVLSKASKV